METIIQDIKACCGTRKQTLKLLTPIRKQDYLPISSEAKMAMNKLPESSGNCGLSNITELNDEEIETFKAKVLTEVSPLSDSEIRFKFVGFEKSIKSGLEAFSRQDIVEAKAFFERAIRKSDTAMNLLRAIKNLADVYRVFQEFEKLVFLYECSLILARAAKDKQREANILTALENVLSKAKEFEKLQDILQREIALLDEGICPKAVDPEDNICVQQPSKYRAELNKKLEACKMVCKAPEFM